MKTLPSLPSELLKLAMHDLELCEQDEKYVIDMKRWHLPFQEKCLICLAGSVMAKSFKCINNYFDNNSFDIDIGDKFLAIDYLRKGFIYHGLDVLKYLESFPSSIPYEYEPGYGLETLSETNRPEWKLHMATIIGILECENL